MDLRNSMDEQIALMELFIAMLFDIKAGALSVNEAIDRILEAKRMAVDTATALDMDMGGYYE